MTISVIIPVYNAEPWLERCLDSARAQTHRDLEIIAVDDGSTDRSPEICARHAAADSRMKIIRQQNLGPSGARNAGLDAATGSHVLFLDADDFLEPEMAATLLTGVAGGECQWAVTACRQLPPSEGGGEARVIPLGREGVWPSREALMGFARGDVKIMTSFASLWNKIFLADIIRDNRIRFGATCPGTDIPVYPQEDFFFNLAYLRHADNTRFIDQPLYNYQTHSGNANAVRKYRPHAFELHQEVYRTVRREILPLCNVKERRAFNRHYVDKTLIILAILCRDNQVLDRRALLGKIRTIAADPEIRAALADCSPTGSQSNVHLWLLRRRMARILYCLYRRRGNALYGSG